MEHEQQAPVSLKTGVCSITFRKLSIEEVTQLTARAGLDAIEWGGDVHVPPGDLAAAELARRHTRESGLVVSSYGSYYRILDKEGEPEDFSPVLESAQALGTDTIRIWAGTYPSELASPEYQRTLFRTLDSVLDRAREQGVRLALEFHANTLTDSNYSAAALLDVVQHPALWIYWQPMYWVADPDYRLRGLEQMRDRVLNLHVFHWTYCFGPDPIDRRPLSEGEAEWRHLLKVPLREDTTHTALLEFVRDEDPEIFLRDAETLTSWVK